MRILIVTTTFPATSQTFIDLHCESLLALGHEVKVIARPGKGVAKKPLRDLLVPVKPVRRRGWAKLLDFIRQLPFDRRSASLVAATLWDHARGRTAGASSLAAAYAQAMRPYEDWDIVHVHFGNVALPIAQQCTSGFTKAKVIVTFHGSDLNIKRKVPNHLLYERVFRTTDLFTVGTEYMAEQLRRCTVAADRVRVVPMGINLADLPTPRPNVGTGPGTRLVSVGRLVEVKGTEFALYAMARLVENWPETTLDLVGDGPRRDYLETLASNLKLRDHVTFHGSLPHEETLRVMRNADVYIHPAVVAADGSVEGQGIVLGEAAALGLPVVASRVGGIPEMVVENESAFLVAPRDVDGLVRCVQSLIEDDLLRRRMGLAGRAFVERNLDQSRLTDEWVKIYDSVMAG